MMYAGDNKGYIPPEFSQTTRRSMRTTATVRPGRFLLGGLWDPPSGAVYSNPSGWPGGIHYLKSTQVFYCRRCTSIKTALTRSAVRMG